MRHGEFLDPLLVPVYDAECRWGPDDDFFLSLVAETPVARVLDLGCGTGRLTVALAAAGHTVTGVDPAGPALAAARRRPGADGIAWVEGTSAGLPAGAYDTAVMTSHVAQVFGTDEEWDRTLADLARALAPGGRLAFDSRDPAARPWERWNPTDSRRLVRLPDGRTVRAWTEVTDARDRTVSFTHHYLFPGGEERLSSATLRFRSEGELRGSLRAAGFAVERVHGGWCGQAVGEGDGELVVVARSSPAG
ncbi:class I SAM-dependent methyltransferase [Micromonospora okii]|uniref:class I SAM-dependent methyltransferase n=1 Tax=Micromonospora okii TaxID=1182970 RepID=UPI001E35BA1E|nr:class I SAM-dependent methyltransferase [Micromonospora okii]